MKSDSISNEGKSLDAQIGIDVIGSAITRFLQAPFRNGGSFSQWNCNCGDGIKTRMSLFSGQPMRLGTWLESSTFVTSHAPSVGPFCLAAIMEFDKRANDALLEKLATHSAFILPTSVSTEQSFGEAGSSAGYSHESWLDKRSSKLLFSKHHHKSSKLHVDSAT